ncbi:hypothetical protein FNV43_RR23600 [Rhamnella rubrinervis]|uniref:Uncharacterized protein n=1 Tax=Rhamnella rubrinervis TaxID=2594499 RepID=A0A8K0DWF7_9ROSA|nr:hypothetical protein FNV43_RR23600 [Rhamnella rubrinervis]
MQSRLAIPARRSTSFFSSQALRRGLASAAAKRTADPAVHAVDYGDDPALFPGKPEESAEPKPANLETDGAENYSRPRNSASGTDPLAPPKPPQATSPRLESTGVNQPLNPTVQQKRSHGSSTSTPPIDVTCAGLDGTPWPKEKEENKGDREAQQEDDNDYYKHHKASPLSEIEVADTRKPITRATDGTADYGKGKDVIGWRPEQLDTADEALSRATKIFTMNAMRAFPDPDAPHSRALRSLRGETF